MKSSDLSKEDYNVCKKMMQEVIDEMSGRFHPDLKELNRAFEFAVNAHGNQRRKDGSPYLTHPLSVAKILAGAGFEEDIIIAGLFHDIVEDCDVSLQEIETRFGSSIAQLVDAVSQVDKEMETESDYTKRDLDFLSDYKLLKKSSANQKAFYVKLADRIHNLNTISAFPPEKQEAKVKHTKTVLIPAAKKMNIFLLVDQLEALCLKIEKPSSYSLIHNGYQKILRENADTLTRLKQYFKDLINQEGLFKQDSVISLDFRERTEGSIFRHITADLKNFNDLPSKVNKEKIYIYDINFVVSDLYPGDPLDLFMKLYPKLNQSRFHFTITRMGHSFSSGALFYHVKDHCENQYRLFIQKETELLHYLHGAKAISKNEENIPAHIMYINEAEPDEPEHKMIKVFLRNGDPVWIEEGASVLDLAFLLHSKIGLCATGGIMKTNNARIALYERLQDGDEITIVHDHHKTHPEDDIVHATIRWFEYLHTRFAIKTLSRWMEKHPDLKDFNIVVKIKKVPYTLPLGSTVLDFAFKYNKEIALCLNRAYLNKGTFPVSFDTILKHDDNISILYDRNNRPDFEWFNMVTTDYAKQCLIEYFKQNT